MRRRCAIALAWALAWALVLVPAGSGAQTQTNPVGPGPGNDEPRRDAPSGSRLRLNPGILIDLSRLLAPAGTEPTHEPGQLLVLWSDEDGAREGLAWIAQREQLMPDEQHVLQTLGGVLAMFQLADDAQARRLRDRLRAAQAQWTVDLNARATPQQRGDAAQPPNRPRLYALGMLGLAPAERAAPTLRVGVVDTALEPTLLPGEAAPWWNGSTVTSRSVLAASDIPAPPAHGHQVAMLMAGAVLANGFAGAAPALQLHWVGAMRRLGDATSTHSLLLARALDWLAGQEVQLINLSVGGEGDEILRTVVSRVLARGIALVAAAGNQPDARAVHPAAYPGVWAVTAVDAGGQPYSRASRGAHIAFATPGVDLWVPDMAGRSLADAASIGRYVSGTSFAAALASGGLARLGADFWRLDPAARKARLCDAARPAAAAQAGLGCGLLRLDALVPEEPKGRSRGP